MRFEGKHSVAADKKIFKNVSERNGSQLFEERLSQTSFIHLVELFITPWWLQLNPCDEILQLNLSTMATLGTEESGRCREV